MSTAAALCRIAAILCLGIAAAAPVFAADAVSPAYRGVVSILPIWPDNLSDDAARQRQEEPEGSGIVIAPGGWLVTAAHVVAPATDVYVRMADGRVLPSREKSVDTATDIAILRIDGNPAPLSFAPEPEVRTPVCAVGNPFGLGLSVSCGVVSARRRTGVGFNRIEDFIQTDAAVNPGMSGGALVDASGRLVGMISAIFTKSADGDLGVNFAISAALLRRVVPSLQKHGEVNWGRPGLVLQPLDRLTRQTLAGVRVARLHPDGAAVAAGLQKGDVIVRAGGRPVRRPTDVMTALFLKPRGEAVSVKLQRNGRVLNLPVKLQ